MGIDQYLSDDRYFEVYKDVGATQVNLDRFFYVLSESFKFIKENKNSPSLVLQEVRREIDPSRSWNTPMQHRLFGSERLLLIFHLARLLRQEWEGQTETLDKELERCSAVVESYLESSLQGEIKKRAMQEVRFVMKRHKYDFDHIKKHLDELRDEESKLKFLYEIGADANIEKDFYSEHLAKFLEMIRTEIRKLNMLTTQNPPSNQQNLAGEQTNTGSLLNNATKIKWLGSERQLAYLIHLLVERGIIEEGRQWQDVADHFMNQKGQPFNAKQLYESMRNVLSSTNRGAKSVKSVTEIIKEFDELSE